MKPGRPALNSGGWNSGTPEEYREIARSYIGYCGRYEVDEDLAMVIHLPAVALVPNLIAQKQQRLVELSGDRLILTASHTRSDGTSISSRLEWSRVH
jgi:Lipocalin-like domain